MSFFTQKNYNLLLICFEYVTMFSSENRTLNDLILGRFPFVRTERPDPSRRNENFTINQSYPTRSVKS